MTRLLLQKNINKTLHEAFSTLKVADLLSSEDVVHLGL